MYLGAIKKWLTDTTVPFLDIYSKDCVPSASTVTLFIIKNGISLNAHRHLDECLMKTWSIYTAELYSDTKMKLCNFRKLENIILSEVTRVQKDKHYMFPLTHRSWLLIFFIYAYYIQVREGRCQETWKVPVQGGKLLSEEENYPVIKFQWMLSMPYLESPQSHDWLG